MFPELGTEYSLPASPYDQWRKQNPNESGHQAWLEAFTKTPGTESTATDIKSFPLFVDIYPFGASCACRDLSHDYKPETTYQDRGTKRVRGHMAQELPTKSDNEETQLRTENGESSEENDGVKAAASSAQEDPCWTLPQAYETEEMRAHRIWISCQRARNWLYPENEC
jgi:hypothetical protein